MEEPYQDLIKTVHDYIEPLELCICDENVLVTLAVEPVKADYFKDDRVQHCICTYRNINTLFRCT